MQPALDAAKQSAGQGLLGRRIGVGLRKGTFGIASGLVTDVITGSGGLATAANATSATIAGFLDKPTRGSGQPIWTSLIRHHKTVDDQLRDIAPQPGMATTGWGISTEASLSVTVTPGSLITDFLPQSSTTYESPNGYQAGNYGPCWCGSGRKYKFCCEGVDRRWRELRSRPAVSTPTRQEGPPCVAGADRLSVPGCTVRRGEGSAMRAQQEAWDAAWPVDNEDFEAAALNDSSVLGRICEVCTFDESVIWFEPSADGSGAGARCSGCGTVYELNGGRKASQ